MTLIYQIEVNDKDKAITIMKKIVELFGVLPEGHSIEPIPSDIILDAIVENDRKAKKTKQYPHLQIKRKTE